MKWVIALAAVPILALAGIIVTHDRGEGSAHTGTHQKTTTISRGDTVDLAPFLRPGVWTVVEFTADW